MPLKYYIVPICKIFHVQIWDKYINTYFIWTHSQLTMWPWALLYIHFIIIDLLHYTYAFHCTATVMYILYVEWTLWWSKLVLTQSLIVVWCVYLKQIQVYSVCIYLSRGQNIFPPISKSLQIWLVHQCSLLTYWKYSSSHPIHLIIIGWASVICFQCCHLQNKIFPLKIKGRSFTESEIDSKTQYRGRQRWKNRKRENRHRGRYKSDREKRRGKTVRDKIRGTNLELKIKSYTLENYI